MKSLALETRMALREIFTNTGALSIMVLAVLIYGIFYPQPYLGETVRNMPIVALDLDNSPTSRQLRARIDAADTTMIAAQAPDMATARQMLMAREVTAIVVIPAGFERDLLAGRQAPIAAYGDASYFLPFNATMTAISTAARGLGAEITIGRMVASGTNTNTAIAQSQPLAISAVALFNPQGGYASYVVPASVILILQQTLLMGIGLLNGGAGKLAGRSDPGTALVARLIAYTALYLVWFCFYLLVLPVIFGLPRIGDLVPLFALGLPFLISVAMLGFTIASLMPSREAVILAMVTIGMPLFFLSGIAWPVEMLPGWLVALAQFVPSTTAIPGLVQVNQMGAGWADIADKAALLWGLAALYGATALVLSRRSEKLRT